MVQYLNCMCRWLYQFSLKQFIFFLFFLLFFPLTSILGIVITNSQSLSIIFFSLLLYWLPRSIQYPGLPPPPSSHSLADSNNTWYDSINIGLLLACMLMLVSISGCMTTLCCSSWSYLYSTHFGISQYLIRSLLLFLLVHQKQRTKV